MSVDADKTLDDDQSMVWWASGKQGVSQLGLEAILLYQLEPVLQRYTSDRNLV